MAAALSLIMLALGAGFGLSAVSPWSNVGASAATVGMAAIIWLIITEAVASAMGGYLAGRLRTKWHAIHNDEVHFRDTANGLLVWAVAVVMTVAFLAAARLPWLAWFQTRAMHPWPLHQRAMPTSWIACSGPTIRVLPATTWRRAPRQLRFFRMRCFGRMPRARTLRTSRS